jgi:hypothetical protein
MIMTTLISQKMPQRHQDTKLKNGERKMEEIVGSKEQRRRGELEKRRQEAGDRKLQITNSKMVNW